MAKAMSNGKRVNKMEAMRRTVSKLGNEASAKDIQAHLKKDHSVEMSLDMVYTYKGTAIKQLAEGGKKGPKPARQPAKVSAGKPASGSVSIAELEAVSALVKKLGAEKVQKLASVLG
jgi:hypothetical protein